jgi:hypothetical protein
MSLPKYVGISQYVWQDPPNVTVSHWIITLPSSRAGIVQYLGVTSGSGPSSAPLGMHVWVVLPVPCSYRYPSAAVSTQVSPVTFPLQSLESTPNP